MGRMDLDQVDQNKQTLYVFVDVDGVLNNISAFKLNKKTIYVLSHENLVVYQWFIDELRKNYNVVLILSSTWRMYKTGLNKIAKLSKKYNALKFDRQTPNSHKHRDIEILEYCNNHNINYDEILIIDDALINNELSNRALHTHFEDGLTWKDARLCLAKLVDEKYGEVINNVI